MDDEQGGKGNFFCALNGGRCPCWPLRLFICMGFLSISALSILNHLELPAQQPWIQLKLWQSQIASFLIWESQKQTAEPISLTPQVQISDSFPMQERNDRVAPPNSRVAVCLVGGARAFELTGPSIKQYLLQTDDNMDVFLHAPLDKDAHKFSLLKDVFNLIHVRIFSAKIKPQTRLHAELLTPHGSPNGIQGLLQYFHLVEGCLDMIKAYQSRFNFTYGWIVRARVDSYWNGPLPQLKNFEVNAYTVPLGSRFGGLNDRLGIGNWKNSQVALSRMSYLPLLHLKGFRRLNSETAFKVQLEVGKVKSVFRSFPFCILSHRSYGWPLGNSGVPVVSLSSKGPLNGAKCRPCSPLVAGKRAKWILEGLMKSWAWTGQSDGMELCDARHDWESDWRDIFDNVAGAKFAGMRKKVENETMSECIKEIEELQEHTEIWDAPSPGVICNRAFTL